MTVVEKARARARAVIETYHYDGICTITEQKKLFNEDTNITSLNDMVVYENQPCHLVFKTITAASQTESAAQIQQTTKLMIAPDIIIKPGSKITVTQGGVTADYQQSGIPAVYQTHQEIVLESFEGWS